MAEAPEQSGATSSVAVLQRVCRHCRLRELCRPSSPAEHERPDTWRHTLRPRHYTGGEFLFRAGDRFRSIYSVRSGAFESYTNSRSGRKDVKRFHLPGELLGLDAIHAQVHRCDAVALEPSVVCSLPYSTLLTFTQQHPALVDEFIRLMSRQIADYESLASGHDARERIAVFLLDVIHRREEHGERIDPLVLPMSREDIASRLQLAPETVTRAITRLQNEGVIEARRKSIHLRSLTKLKEISQA